MILLVLLGLFSACANLGNMLLVRSIARQRELRPLAADPAVVDGEPAAGGIGVGCGLFVGRTVAVALVRIMTAPSDLRLGPIGG